MANTSGDGRAVCPFYDHDIRLGIVCEGLIEEAVDVIRFRTDEEKELFRKRRCDSFEYARSCVIAKILTEKYEEANED